MSIKGRTGVKAGQIQQFRSSLPQADSIFSPLYDYQTYPALGQLQFTFFSVPQGQGTTSAPSGTGAKTLLDTNLTSAGMLPLGNRFLCLGIEVEFLPGPLPAATGVAAAAATIGQQWNDVYSVLRNGALTLTIQNRVFAQDAPLMKFPTQTRLAGVATHSETTATTYGGVGYASGCGAAYDIIPVYIESTQGFNVGIQFPALIPTVSTVAGRLGVRLVGKLVRNAQ